MANLFPNRLVDEIREKNNIAEVISQYIPLKRAGKNFKALCPFHQEKTASFLVSPDKGIFHCFGCGAGGNVFNFIMKYESLEFPQALRMLAQRAKIKLPATGTAKRTEQEADNLFQVNELAASWYQSNLRKDTGRAALGYLKKRAFQAKTILTFKLGFAPANNGLFNFMRTKGVSTERLEKAGLVLRKDSTHYYDRFKQRIIFPIFDSRGRILGFGGRVIDNAQPKYMNSPETAIYNKGKHLYGLNFAKEQIKKEDFCIIVEGYVDLLAAFQHGITNVVASLGTALTAQQINLLKRYTRNVVMVFDADHAGELASLRSLDLLIQEEINVRIVSLPKGEDPDSFLRKFAADNFRQRIAQALDLFDYKLGILMQNHDLDTIEGKVGIASEMLPTIHRVQNSIRRSGYVKRLAQEFSKGEKSLGEEWILAELRKVKADFEYYTSKESISRRQFPLSRSAEEMILQILLQDETAVVEIKKHLKLEDFRDWRIRETLRVIFQLHQQGKDFCADGLISSLASEETAQLISRLSSSSKELIDREKSLSDCIGRIKIDNLKVRLNSLQRQIKLAQSWGHNDKIVQLVSEYSNLIKSQGGAK